VRTRRTHAHAAHMHARAHALHTQLARQKDASVDQRAAARATASVERQAPDAPDGPAATDNASSANADLEDVDVCDIKGSRRAER
jgi:hypothetical protein